MSDITVGSVAVDIVPDTRGFAEKLKAKLAGITAEIGLTADTAEVRAQLEELTRPRTATINANADTGEAEAQLDEVARSRTASINANADGKGLSGMLAGIVTLGPALIPITAAVTGLVAALGAPIAAAGGGLTVFGLIGGAMIAKTQKVAKQIAELRQKANTLVDPKAAAAAAAQADALEATLTGPQKAFLAAKNAVSTAFETLTKTSGKDVFKPVNDGLKLLAQLMPAVAPIIHSVSGALSDMIQSIGQSAKSGGLKSFLDFLGKASGPALAAFAAILGNLATGVGGLIAAFAPVGEKLTQKLIDLSGAFADFGSNAGSNKGLQSFIAYVQQEGPQVAKVFGDVIQAVANLASALAPIGGIVLAGIGIFAKIVASIPTPILAYMAGVLVTIVAGLKAWAIVQAVLDALLAANPIGIVVLAIAGLVVGLIAAYKKSETFRDIVDGAFRAIAAAGKFMWENVLKPVFKFLISAWLTVAGAIVHGAAAAFGWVPGLGGKLKAAAAKFDEFRDSVNAALDGIHSTKEIHLNVTTRQIVANPSIAKPRVQYGTEGAGATGAIINRPTVLLAGEAGREALIPLDQTPGNEPLSQLAAHSPDGRSGTSAGVDYEQALYRGMGRALSDHRVVIAPKRDFDALDLVVTG